MTKKVLKILGFILIGIISLFLIAMILIRIPTVQRWILDKSIASIEKSINGKINVGGLDISFFDNIVINDFSITSNNYSEQIEEFKRLNNQNDTLVKIDRLNIAFSLGDILKKNTSISLVDIDGGVFNLHQETENETNIDRIFSNNKKEKDSNKSDFSLSVKNITIDDFRFNLSNPFKINQELTENHIDFSNLRISKIELRAKNFNYTSKPQDNIKVKLISLSGEDASGFKLEELSGDVLITPKRASIVNALLTDGMSEAIFEEFALNYANAKTLANFVDSVVIEADLKESILDFRTLGKISPGLTNSSLRLRVEGRVEGPIRQLYSNQIIASDANGTTNVNLSNISLIGLPNPKNTHISATINEAKTDGKELAKFLSELTGDQKIEFFERMPKDAIYTYKGDIGGTLLNLTTNGHLQAYNGGITLNSHINTENVKTGVDIGGNYQFDNFDLGKIIGNNDIGKISGKGNVKVAGKGRNISVNIDSLVVKQIEIFERKITNTNISGRYADERFIGHLNTNDPAIKLTFNGEIPTSSSGGDILGEAIIDYIDLNKLGIDQRNKSYIAGSHITTNIQFDGKEEFLGWAKIENTIYRDSIKSYKIGDIDITSSKNDGMYNIDWVSDFLEARYSSQAYITDFIQKIKSLIIEDNFSNLLKENYNVSVGKDAYYSLKVNTYNTQSLCALLMNDLYIQSGTNFNMEISQDDKYEFNLMSGRVAMGKDYFKNIQLNANNRNSDNDLNLRLFSKDIVVKGFKVDSARVAIKGKNNFFSSRVQFHNDTTGENKTNLIANLEFLKDTIIAINDSYTTLYQPIKIDIDQSYIKLKGENWDISPTTLIINDSLNIIDNLKIINGKQSLFVNGTISPTIKDSLSIRMEKFDVAIVDQYLSNPLYTKGYLSGRGIISMNKGNNRMFAAFVGDSMSVYHTDIGELRLMGRWSPENKNYDLLVRTTQNDSTNFEARGYYRPNDSYLDINTTLKDLSVTYFEPLLNSLISKTSGSLKGKIRLYGHTDNLILTGEDCQFDNFKFTLDYTKVPYTLSGPIGIQGNKISLNNSILTDKFNNKATINAEIEFKEFKDILLNLKGRFRNFHLLSTTELDNPDFYGDAYSSGNIEIKGDLKNLNIGISAQSDPKTFIHIPISKGSSSTKNDLLTFVQEEKIIEIDPYDTLHFSNKKIKKEPVNLSVNLNITANDNAEIWLEVDKINGDIIKAKGDGNINIKVDPSKDQFSLNGNYTINDGHYHFVLMGITSRDFNIQNGSKVTLNGTPDDIDLDITGLYSTKAAINRLIGDTTSVNITRKVEAYIYIKGKMAEPKISFGIEIPDIDQTVKTRVQSALNTQEKVEKQMAALLVSGGFLPDMDNGISSSSSNMLYSNVSAIISNQIDKIFAQLGIPLDLGINYVPGEKSASDAFDVAISTQLFNNRVLINGNIGNDPYSDYNGRNVIGNIDIDVKLDQSGKVRLNLFSHSTDRYSNDLEESQRNGLGLTYQKEFNSIKDLFRRRSAARKEYEKLLKERKKAERQAERQAKRKRRKEEKSK